MKTHRYAAGERRDANEPEIIEVFELWGATVSRIRGTLLGRKRDRKPPDLLVGYLGVNRVVEVKMPGEKLSDGQESWCASWRGDRPYVVTTVEQARDLMLAWRAEAKRTGQWVLP